MTNLNFFSETTNQINRFIDEYSYIIQNMIKVNRDDLKFLIKKYPQVEYNFPQITIFHSTIKISFSDSDFFHQENDNALILELHLDTIGIHKITLDYLIELNNEIKYEYMEDARFTFNNMDNPSLLTNVKPNTIYKLCYGFGVYGNDRIIFIKSNLESDVRKALDKMISIYGEEIIQDNVIKQEMKKDNVNIDDYDMNSDHTNEKKLIWLKSQIETFINNRYATIYKDTYTSLSLIPIQLLE